MSYLNLSITFLDGTYHGRGNGGNPEWPPSPLRLFQSLVATAAARWKTSLPNEIAATLEWLGNQPPPIIIAPQHHIGVPYTTSVPNNAMDIVARCWSRGNETGKDAQVSTHKAMKTFCTSYLESPHTVTYLWSIIDDPGKTVIGHIERLKFLAAQTVAVGWGIDLVAGYGQILDETDIKHISGKRWDPVSHASDGLRTPNATTLAAVMDRHQIFLRRLDGGHLSPVPALSPSAYSQVAYRRSWEPSAPSIAAFEFLKLDTRGWRPFDTLKTCRVAGMLRFATKQAAKNAGWTEQRIGRFILGHKESEGDEHQPVGPERFAFVPLPSLETRSNDGPANHVGDIRRALLFVPAGGHRAEIDWARRSLAGCELIGEHKEPQVQALISLIRETDGRVTRYTKHAATWATVAPVILPGYDDPRHYRRRLKKDVSVDEQKRLLQKLSDRTDSLIRKAIIQAGLSDTLAMHAEIEWRKVGYWPGADHADRYFVPKKLQQFSRYHVRITWRDPAGNEVAIPGPIVIGGGRYRGLGAFAAVE